MQDDFDKALTQDLGKDTFTNWVLEFTACIRECDDAIANLKSWMKNWCTSVSSTGSWLPSRPTRTRPYLTYFSPGIIGEL